MGLLWMKHLRIHISNNFSVNAEKVIKKSKFTPHSLYGSYATELWCSIYLGVIRAKTTTRYTHIISDALINVTSPFDKMMAQMNKEITNKGQPPQIFILLIINILRLKFLVWGGI